MCPGSTLTSKAVLPRIPIGELFAASATISDGVKEALFPFNNCHSFLLISEIEAPVYQQYKA